MKRTKIQATKAELCKSILPLALPNKLILTNKDQFLYTLELISGRISMIVDTMNKASTASFEHDSNIEPSFTLLDTHAAFRTAVAWVKAINIASSTQVASELHKFRAFYAVPRNPFSLSLLPHM